jgi:hypothetical protein
MEFLKRIYAQYRRATREEKSNLLDGFCRTAHIHRKHAIRLLAGPDPGHHSAVVSKPRGRSFRYGAQTIKVLEAIWRATGFLCGLRLKAALPDWIESARRRWAIDEATERQLLAISPRQIDRRLAPQKHRLKQRLYGTTKPGALLRHMIPVRTDFWDVHRPGFTEVDLVSHSGPCAAGDFINTLNATDIHTLWDEQTAIFGKSEAAVLEGMRDIEARLPFDLKGMDSDNGSEFLNHSLWNFCRRRPPHRKVQFTRSRPYRKNDNAHIEQKNGPRVRQIIGYDRYDTPEALQTMNKLYAKLRLLNNLFLPSVKLLRKIHKGSKVIRRYDKPRTAFQRLLACPQMDRQKVNELQRIKETTDPFALAEEIDRLLAALFELVSKPRPGRSVAPAPDHPWRKFSFSKKLKRRESLFKKCNVRWLNNISKKQELVKTHEQILRSRPLNSITSHMPAIRLEMRGSN